MNRRFLIGASLAAAFLTACSPSGLESHDGNGAGVKVLSVENAVVHPPLPGRDIAMGTMAISNMTARDDVLVSVTSPISDRVEMHTHIKDGNVMKMRRLEQVVVPAGEITVFKRGGYHLMMFGAQLPEGSKSVPLTLTFQSGDRLEVRANIDGFDAERYGSGH